MLHRPPCATEPSQQQHRQTCACRAGAKPRKDPGSESGPRAVPGERGGIALYALIPDATDYVGERLPHVGCAAKPFGRVLCEAAFDHQPERMRYGVGQWTRRLMENRPGELVLRLPGEGQLACGHFVEQHTQRPDVAAAISGLAAEQLRGHVRRRSGQLMRRSCAASRERRHGRGIEPSRNPEVHHLDVVGLGDHHVGRLQILVQYAPIVRMRQRIGNLDPVSEHPLERQGRVAEQLRDGGARDVLHHQIRATVELVHLVDRADVRMCQACGRLGLPPKIGRRARVAVATFTQDLEGDVALERLVPGAIHRTHAAHAQQLSHFVVADLGTGRHGAALGQPQRRLVQH